MPSPTTLEHTLFTESDVMALSSLVAILPLIFVVYVSLLCLHGIDNPISDPESGL